MADTLAGTGTLLRLAVRRDRWLLPSWALGFAAMAGFSASATADLYPEVALRVEAANAVNATPSLVALYGRIYDPTSLGSLALFKMTAFGAAMFAVLMVFVTVRHTRAEEESNRLELLGAGVVGRDAPLAAALLVALGGSLLLGLLTAVAIAASGLPLAGSVAFGAGWAMCGIAFSAVAAVTAQLTGSARTATGLGITAVAGAYALRAIGDMTEGGPSVLSWLSPIGWTQQLRAFAGNRWWVVVLPLALSAALAAAAFVLRARRDLGGGLLPDRTGPARGVLAGVWDLAVRLQRGVLVAWTVAFLVFGLVLGSVTSSVSGMLSAPTMRKFLEVLGGEQGIVSAFLAAELGIFGLIVSAYGMVAVSHLRSEETAGHAEPLLATATSRARWATSHLSMALGGVALLLLTAAVGIAVGYALDVGQLDRTGQIVVAALARVPAAWVMAGLVLAVFGWAPRLTGLVWGLFAAFVAIGEFGSLWHAPQWLMDLSPFVHSPALPVTSGGIGPVLALTATAAALTAVGYAGWRRRDLSP